MKLLQNARDALQAVRAANAERKGGFAAALQILEASEPKGPDNRVFRDLYRAKLMIVLHDPRVKDAVAELEVKKKDWAGLRNGGYYQTYVDYLSAVIEDRPEQTSALARKLEASDIIAFKRRALPAFNLWSDQGSQQVQ